VDQGKEWKPVSLSAASADSKQKSKDNSNISNKNTILKDVKDAQKLKIEKKNSRVIGAAPLPTSAKPEETARDLTKEELFKGIMSKFTSYYAIVSSHNSAPIIHSGKVPKVKIILESRMGNKTVTLIRGLEIFNIEFFRPMVLRLLWPIVMILELHILQNFGIWRKRHSCTLKHNLHYSIKNKASFLNLCCVYN
jgi:hypothetical protein